MHNVQNDIEERSNLTGSNKFELLLFRLGPCSGSDRAELYGINVFKIREIVAMPTITAIAGAVPHMLGVVNLRGEIIPVIDLPGVVGCTPTTGLNIILVTEFARTVQAFAVEAVEDIVRLEWNEVLSAEGNSAGTAVTSIARLDGNVPDTRLAQVLDVETIVRQMTPTDKPDIDPATVGPGLLMKAGTVILAADDSVVARKLIEQGLEAIGARYIMTKTGKEAWDRLNALAREAEAEGVSIRDKVALVLSDLEMPEMDGFTLTRNIKQSSRFNTIPVVIHSSLSGSANEDLVMAAGANAYVAKFVAEDLAATIRRVLVT
jgi:two-component system, chemotaxis family, chemotaxis protein CheV